MSSPPDVVFFGTAGHARSFAESAQRRAPHPLARVVAYIDDYRGEGGETLDGAPVVSFERWRSELRDVPVFVAVGQPHTRQALAERVAAAGGRFVSLYDRAEPLAPGVTVGEGTLVFALVAVGASTAIGRHVHVMPLVSIDGGCAIGDFTTVCPSATIYGRVFVEAGVFVGVGARIVNEADEPLRVGAGAVIGAGAVVTRPVAPGSKLAGNPAQDLRALAAARRNGLPA